jgi:hypothetical protein
MAGNRRRADRGFVPGFWDMWPEELRALLRDFASEGACMLLLGDLHFRQNESCQEFRVEVR